jgi:ankyrin repeat protein
MVPPLCAAAAQNCASVIEWLVHHDEDISSVVPGTGLQPLHVAAMIGHEAATRKLIEEGANTTAADVKDHTPWMYAARRRHTRIADILQRAELGIKYTRQPHIATHAAPVQRTCLPSTFEKAIRTGTC